MLERYEVFQRFKVSMELVSFGVWGKRSGVRDLQSQEVAKTRKPDWLLPG